ncbi:Universal stress protein family protein [Roseivivax jejudonensis]|uniref:Universal stress protein family protein n=1 Tax=Roseivivax jejudonensis TaxID=1529041 RepID=A0A1X6Z5K2_9RHOB|nr:universal stress protein [Roseivivax jejudonensis]SLN41595.1 Universal stress protein family protein [Roseivivax jejudonensis]
MTLKTIAAVFTSVEPPEPLCRAAATLARLRDAHLLGVAVSSDPRYYPALGSYMAGEVIAQITRQQDTRADEIRAAFDAAVKAEDVRGEWRFVRSGIQTVAERILESGRAADLVLLARPTEYVHQIDDVHEQVIRGLGRPVLLVPPSETLEHVGQSALIGWSRTREAARAAFDAVPLLDPGAEVTLLNVGARSAHDLADGPMNEVAAALARHGLTVTVTHREPDGEGAAAIILREAREIGASFIATGAFGHSRAYDFVVGAVTRELLSDCPLPVLFSK